jgi:hypothetical protein
MKKSKPTKRKFYGKWLYKVTLLIKGIYTIKYSFDSRKTQYVSSIENSLIEHLVKELKTVPKESWGRRIECNNIDIYTNDKELYLRLSEEFDHCLVHRFEPMCNLDQLVDSNVSVVNKYPYDRYHYKVFLTPYKFNGDKDRKAQFLEWLETQGDKVKVSDAVKYWFIRMDWNWGRRYMYVQDEQTLLMVKMRESNAIGKVHKYTLADK